jgi:FAD dependent oxidoreductase
MKIVVVGAGIAGSIFTRFAREAGHEVVVVAPDDKPDSLAATAILRKGYHAGKPEQIAAWEFAVETYERLGLELKRGAMTSGFRRLGSAETPDSDWLLIDPAAPLVVPDVKRTVVTVKGGNAWTGPEDRDRLAGDAVVAACGATGALAPSGKVTWGVTWLHADGALREPQHIRVYQYAPYRTLMGGVAGGQARVGSSSAATREKAVEQGKKMLDMAWHLGWLTTRDNWEMRLGARLKSDRLWWRDEESECWRLGGFHRTGYALAPAAARDLLERLTRPE